MWISFKLIDIIFRKIIFLKKIKNENRQWQSFLIFLFFSIFKVFIIHYGKNDIQKYCIVCNNTNLFALIVL